MASLRCLSSRARPSTERPAAPLRSRGARREMAPPAAECPDDDAALHSLAPPPRLSLAWVQLTDFKVFRSAAVGPFHPEMTCVVGPNGTPPPPPRIDAAASSAARVRPARARHDRARARARHSMCLLPMRTQAAASHACSRGSVSRSVSRAGCCARRHSRVSSIIRRRMALAQPPLASPRRRLVRRRRMTSSWCSGACSMGSGASGACRSAAAPPPASRQRRQATAYRPPTRAGAARAALCAWSRAMLCRTSSFTGSASTRAGPRALSCNRAPRCRSRRRHRSSCYTSSRPSPVPSSSASAPRPSRPSPPATGPSSRRPSGCTTRLPRRALRTRPRWRISARSRRSAARLRRRRRGCLRARCALGAHAHPPSRPKQHGRRGGGARSARGERDA